MKISTFILSMLVVSCCGVCTQPMPKLRPMPIMDEPVVEQPVKVFHDKNGK